MQAETGKGDPKHQQTRQVALLVLLFAAGVVNFFDRTALSIANTSVRGELHLSAMGIGWLLSAFSLAYGVAQLPLVALLRRVPTRRVFGAGLVLWSAAQGLTGLVRTVPQFLLMRVGLGLGESPFYPCGVGLVREEFGEARRGRATAVMSMSQTLGLAVAPPALTLLMLHVGWRWMFGTLGLGGLLVAAAWWAFAGAPSEAQGMAATASPTKVWRGLLRSRTVWGMMLGFSGVNYTNWLYTAWLPGYLQQARHLSLARTGWLAAIPFLAGALGMLTSGLLSDGLRQRGFALTSVHRVNLVAGLTMSAAGTLVVARSGSTATAIAGTSAALFFVHFAGTSGWGYVQTVAPEGLASSLSALQNFASFLIASVAPVLTGWLLDRTHSFTSALAICAGVAVLGAVSYATLAAPRGNGRLFAQGQLG